METIERVGNPSVAPFGDADPRDVVYVAAVSCARCGEVNHLVPASAMFLCAWCVRGERSPAAAAAASLQQAPTVRRRRISVRTSARTRRAA
ncbi:MAG: hypothetical protein ACM3OO_06610 [Planctomycetaceae bacterium]